MLNAETSELLLNVWRCCNADGEAVSIESPTALDLRPKMCKLECCSSDRADNATATKRGENNETSCVAHQQIRY